jgi:hypothetical protein
MNTVPSTLPESARTGRYDGGNGRSSDGLMFLHFFHTEAAGGVVLLAAALAALLAANSPWAAWHHESVGDAARGRPGGSPASSSRRECG